MYTLALKHITLNDCWCVFIPFDTKSLELKQSLKFQKLTDVR